jgi:ABC-type multidrug transport system fused ATPase/permease subunit
VSHRLATVRDCDRLFFLERGRLAGQGSYDELLASSAAFRELSRAAEGEDRPA